MGERECLVCGMPNAGQVPPFGEEHPQWFCIKCDSLLMEQSDGSVLTRDIAHQHETLAQAERKLYAALDEAWGGYAERVRLIVGGGRIREVVLGQLQYYRDAGFIPDFAEPRGNPGAVVVRVR